MAQTFDYSNGSVVVQGGIIYYSPNCTRPVVIPPRPVYPSDPFRHRRLDASMFKQPVWWSYGWAWQSFIPLSPSFVFTPFEPLCAMPRIEEVTFTYTTEQSEDVRRETRFRMNEDDIQHRTIEHLFPQHPKCLHGSSVQAFLCLLRIILCCRFFNL